MAGMHVILAIFPDEAKADEAVAYLKTRDGVPDDAIGVLVLDESGNVKVDKVGTRSTGKGAGIGALLGLLGPVGIIGGTVGGAVVGAFHHKGLGLDEADRQRIAGELEGGKAAVGVLAHHGEEDEVTALLTRLGGELEVHPVSDEALQAADPGPA
jgi:uncharacterized membrane protein